LKTLAIIPARGGSKGIPGKNLAQLNGRPLIEYTISAAQSCDKINHIFVSSDDDKILKHCANLGVDTEYVRPSHLASDTAGMFEVVMDALDWLAKKKQVQPEIILLLQPTSPLRNTNDIDKILSLLESSGHNSAVSVHEMTEHPLECIQSNVEGWDNLKEQSGRLVRRQDYERKYYFINGAIYAFTPEFLKKEKLFAKPGKSTALCEMPSHRGIDINTLEDLYRAEAYLAHPKLNNIN